MIPIQDDCVVINAKTDETEQLITNLSLILPEPASALVSIMCHLVWPDEFRLSQTILMQSLNVFGYAVRRETPIGVSTNGKERRINLIAEKDGYFIAIELDRRSPRKSTIEKINMFDGVRIVALRGSAQPVPGAHVCIGLMLDNAPPRKRKTRRSNRKKVNGRG